MMAKAKWMALGLLLITGLANAAGYVEGKHYQRLNTTVPPVEESEAPNEVVELFFYGCPHCFDMEPYLEDWHEKADAANVNFVRVPAIFNQRWELMARVYYALEIMGELEAGHALVFDGIHAQGRTLRDEGSVARFLAANGIDEAKFREAFHSFAMEAKISRAKQLLRQYEVTGVPTVIVNGKYKVSATTAGGYTQVIDVIKQLTEDGS